MTELTLNISGGMESRLGIDHLFLNLSAKRRYNGPSTFRLQAISVEFGKI